MEYIPIVKLLHILHESLMYIEFLGKNRPYMHILVCVVVLHNLSTSYTYFTHYIRYHNTILHRPIHPHDKSKQAKH